MSNPHPDRPIAQPRRRLNRTTSTNSLGSVSSAGGSSPLANFSFSNPSVTSMKPPAPPNFGFGNPTGFQSGFGSPASSAAGASSSTGFAGFGNAVSSPSPSPFGGFAPFGGFTPSTNTNSGPFSSSSPFAQSATTPTTAPQTAFGFNKTSSTASPFGGFGHDTFKSSTTETKETTTSSQSETANKPFLASRNSITSVTSDTSTQAVIASPSPFPFMQKAEKSEPPKTTSATEEKASTSTSTDTVDKESKAAAPISLFGKPASTSKADETPKTTTSAFTFGNPSTLSKAPTDTADKESKTATPVSFFGKPADASKKDETSKTTTSAFSFGNPSLSSNTSTDTANKESKTAAPVSFFGKPANTSKADETPKTTTSAFSFGNPSTLGNASTDASPFTFKPKVPADDKPSPFGSATVRPDDKPSPFGSSIAKPDDKPSPSGSSIAKPDDKPSPFGSTTAKPDDKSIPKPFTFNLISTPPTSSSANAPATSAGFTFGKPASDKPSPFSINAPPISASSGSSNKKRQLNRDDDEEDGRSSNKKTFTFSATPSTASNTTASTNNMPPPFTFGSVSGKTVLSEMPDHNKAELARNEVFKMKGKEDADKQGTSKEDTDKPFSFNINKTSSNAPGWQPNKSNSSPFTFASVTKSKDDTAEKKDDTAVKNFSFGAPPTEKKSAESEDSKPDNNKPSSMTGSAASNTSDDSNTKPTDTSKASNANLIHGKSPLSKAISLLPSSESSKDGVANDKPSSGFGKGTSFGFPSASSSTDTTSIKPAATSEPGSVSLAFSKTKSAEDSNTFATLNLRPNENKDSISSRATVQTTLHSSITESSQITYKTRFWELPDDARNELALLANFITEQTDKKDKIEQELGSYFGTTLKELNTSALAMNNDALILSEKLEFQSKALEELIAMNKEQRLNAVSASSVQQQENKNWRMRGATENWNFFNNAVGNMEERLAQLSQTAQSVEEAVAGLQSEAPTTPQNIGAILDQQRAMYLSLAGRVAEIHQDVDHLIVKRRKLTK